KRGDWIDGLHRAIGRPAIGGVALLHGHHRIGRGGTRRALDPGWHHERRAFRRWLVELDDNRIAIGADRGSDRLRPCAWPAGSPSESAAATGTLALGLFALRATVFATPSLATLRKSSSTVSGSGRVAI